MSELSKLKDYPRFDNHVLDLLGLTHPVKLHDYVCKVAAEDGITRKKAFEFVMVELKRIGVPIRYKTFNSLQVVYYGR